MARGSARGQRTISEKWRSSNDDHPIFARYREMLRGLETLDRKGEEVRRKVQERRRQTLG